MGPEQPDQYDFVVRWSDDENAFVAQVADWPGVRAFASTREAAIQRAEHMLQLAIETHRDRGWEPPRPAPIAEGTGQFRLRLPRQLHAQLAALAARNSVSLNQFVVSQLAESVGRASEINRAAPSIYSAAMEVLRQILPTAHASLFDAVRKALQETHEPQPPAVGVPASQFASFFNSPSQYERVGGAGLGLSIARHIAAGGFVSPGSATADASASSVPHPATASSGGGDER